MAQGLVIMEWFCKPEARRDNRKPGGLRHAYGLRSRKKVLGLLAGRVTPVSLPRVRIGVHEGGGNADIDSSTKPDALVVHEIMICPEARTAERRGAEKTAATSHVRASLSTWDGSLRTRLVVSVTSARTRFVPAGKAKPVTVKTVEVAPDTARLLANHCTLSGCVAGAMFDTDKETDAALVSRITLVVAGDVVSIGRIWP